MKKGRVVLFFILMVVLGLGTAISSKNSLKIFSNQFQGIGIIEKTKKIDIPIQINIPKIKVKTKVESVGMDRQGRMDIPREADNAAWYNLGYKPGEKGNAVIDGHLDKATGAPAVFWSLHTLKPGDKIIITEKNGEKIIFSVKKTLNFPYNKFPLKQIFGPGKYAMLNLITCEGKWDTINKNYSERTVVFAEISK